MNTIVESRQIYLSSNFSKTSNKKNGTMNSDITFYIPKLIQETAGLLYSSIKLSHCEIPYSFYIINSTNNKLIINNIEMIIDEGNYNANSLMITLNELLATNNILGTLFTFNPSIGKYILTSSQYFTIFVSSIRSIIGLDDNIYSGIFNGVQYSLTFPFPVNTGGVKNIFIKTNIITSNINTYDGSNMILKSIPVNVPPYGQIFYNNIEGIETIIKNRELNQLDIQLVDDDNNLIDFNNINWSICISILSTFQLTMNSLSLNDYFNNNKTVV
jgi:hypothetical protein